jgi:hypothetical protein
MKKRTDSEHKTRHVTPASRSVFYDLGFDEAEARVSALMKGVWRDFSADMLLVLATRVGLRPTLKLAA